MSAKEFEELAEELFLPVGEDVLSHLLLVFLLDPMATDDCGGDRMGASYSSDSYLSSPNQESFQSGSPELSLT